MTTDLLWLCPAFAVVAGSLVWVVRHKHAARIRSRLLRDLVGLQTVWEEADRRMSLGRPVAG